MGLTKTGLGYGYLVSSGLLLGLALLGHAVVAVRSDPVLALLACLGAVPALALAGSAQWLSTSGLEGVDLWSIAQWSGLGIGFLTLVHVGVLVVGPPPAETLSVLLATSVALGGLSGVLVGALLALRTTATRMERGKRVLSRVIRHNLRNDLTVVRGHVGELRRNGTEDAEHLAKLDRKIEEMATMAEKAGQIDTVLTTDRRGTRPVDVVEPLEERLEAVRRTYPDATVETDMPDRCYVQGDWLLKTILDNVVENVLVHAPGAPHLRVTVTPRAETVLVRITDNCPPLPENERVVFSEDTESPVVHSTGLGLWLVRFVVDSYDGQLSYTRTDSGGNRVELLFRSAPDPGDGSRLARVGRTLRRSVSGGI